MPWIHVDYADGRFSWREVDPKVWTEAVEISDERFALWKAAKALDTVIQDQLLALDNAIFNKRHGQE